MPLFAEATNLTPEQVQNLADEAARLQALPPEQVAALPPSSSARRTGDRAGPVGDRGAVLPLAARHPARAVLPDPGVPALLPGRRRRVLADPAAVEHGPRLAAGRRQLPLLRRVERRASRSWSPATATLDYLFARGMDADRPPRAAAPLMLVASIGDEPRRAVLLQVPRLLPRTSCTTCSPGSAYDPGTRRSRRWTILIPFGISFYTFEAINYTVDVYRGQDPGRAEPAALPAVHPVLPAPGRRADRPGRRLPAAGPPAEALELGAGAGRRAVVPARACSRSWPSPTAWRCSPTRCFADPGGRTAPAAVWLAVLAYALRIYCDFSGYSDMALGHGPPARLQADAELQHAVPGGEHHRVLAALAHLAVDLAARLPVHPAGRQPRRAGG